MIIDGNVFEGNHGQSVYVEEQSFSPVTIKNNALNLLFSEIKLFNGYRLNRAKNIGNT
jgi:hypothetical protein